MAFPTTSLVNNQVHKEGNRAWVYDSTAGVWDQVKEVDNPSNDIYVGTLGLAVTYPSGHIIQVVNSTFAGITTISNTSTANIFNCDIVTHKTGSNFFVATNLSHSNANVDQDIAAAVGFKTGHASTTLSDYSATGHSTYSIENIGTLGSWYGQDTIGGGTAGTWGGAYRIKSQNTQYMHTPSTPIAAGTQLNYALWAATQGSGGFVRVGGPVNGSGAAGMQMYLTIMEIAT